MAVIAYASITLAIVSAVESITNYYLLQSATSARPAKPTTLTPSSSWGTQEPAYSDTDVTQALYTTTRTVFTDGTFAWADVSLSSSYEAAKSAYNRAVASGQSAAEALYAAQAAQASVDGVVTRVTTAESDITQLKNQISLSVTSEMKMAIESAQTLATRASIFIQGTQTAATNKWTGVFPLSSLIDGQQITYWLPVASNTNVTLELTLPDGTTTGEIPVYYGGTTNIGKYYGEKNAIHLTYRENVGTIAQGWWADANYNVDTNTNTWGWQENMRVTAGAVGLFPYTLMMQTVTGAFDSITTSGGTGAAKQLNTEGFRPGILLANGNYTVAANAAHNGTRNTGDGSIRDARYWINITNTAGIRLEAGQTLYLVGSIHLSDGLFYFDNPWWTVTEPTEEDGKVYLRMGVAYDWYRVAGFSGWQPWAFVGTAFKEFTDTSELTAALQAISLRLAEQETLYGELDSRMRTAEEKITDEAIISTVTESSVYKTGLEESIQSAIQQTKDALEVRFSNIALWQNNAADVLSVMRDLETWIRLTNDPALELGRSDSPFTTRITNEKWAILYRLVESLWITSDGAHMKKAEVESSMTLGKTQFFCLDGGDTIVIN